MDQLPSQRHEFQGVFSDAQEPRKELDPLYHPLYPKVLRGTVIWGQFVFQGMAEGMVVWEGETSTCLAR